MKHNQVYLDPQNIEESMRQLERFYRLDAETLAMLRRIVERYPAPVLMYVDEANAPLYADNVLDDLFTFNTQTGELVLFSSDPMTFVDGLIEMWMFVNGFETLMGSPDYWKVEFAIGSWKPIKNALKRELGIPVNEQVVGIVGLPPEPEEAMMEDPYPFKTLVSRLTVVSFAQMVRLAGRPEVRVHFPPGADPRVIEVYFNMRRAMQSVAAGLSIEDVDRFNTRLHDKLAQLEERYQPGTLPVPAEFAESPLAGVGEGESDDPLPEESRQAEEEELEGDTAIDRLLHALRNVENTSPNRKRGSRDDDRVDNIQDVDRKLEKSPFADFIDKLFEE